MSDRLCGSGWNFLPLNVYTRAWVLENVGSAGVAYASVDCKPEGEIRYKYERTEG